MYYTLLENKDGKVEASSARPINAVSLRDAALERAQELEASALQRYAAVIAVGGNSTDDDDGLYGRRFTLRADNRVTI